MERRRQTPSPMPRNWSTRPASSVRFIVFSCQKGFILFCCQPKVPKPVTCHVFLYNRWSKWSFTPLLIKVSKNPTPGFTCFHWGPCSTAFTITAGSWRSSASKTFSLGEFVSTSCGGTGGRGTYCGCRCSMLMYLMLCLYMFVYLVYLSLLVWTEPVHLILKEHLPNFIWIDCMITFCNFLSFPRLPVTCLNTQSPRCNMFHIVSQASCQWN